MTDDALELFIDTRLDLLLGRLRKFLGEIPFEVIDTRPAAWAPLLSK